MHAPRSIFAFCPAFLFACAIAQPAGASMDHIMPVESLTTSEAFGTAQRFGDLPEFSGMLVDDFMADGLVTSVSFAFEAPASFDIEVLSAWQISIWDSRAAVEATNSEFSAETVASVEIEGTISEIFGAAPAEDFLAYQVSFSDISLDVGRGRRYIGVAAILDFGSGDQIFALANSNPTLIGAGTANDAFGINPGEGFGQRVFEANTNAAYQVVAVPEPGSMAALLLGIVLGRRKKRTVGTFSSGQSSL